MRRALPLVAGSLVAVVASVFLYSALKLSIASSATDLANRIATIVSG